MDIQENKKQQLVFLGTHNIFGGVFDSHNLGFLKIYLKNYSEFFNEVIISAFIPKKLSGNERKIVDEKKNKFYNICKQHRLKCIFLEFKKDSFSDLHKNKKELEKLLKKDPYILAQNYFNGYIGYLLKKSKKNIYLHLLLKGVAPEEERDYSNSNIFVRHLKYFVLKNFEKKICKIADSFTVVSNKFKEYISKKYNLKSNKFIIYPSTVNTDRFYIDNKFRMKFRKKLKISNNEKLIFYSGSFQKWQLPDNLFRMFANYLKFRNYTGLILTFDKKYAEQLKKKYNLNNLIIKTATGKELNGYYNAADIGIISRKQDLVNRVASPTKIAEYLVTGNSIILNEGIGDYSNYLKNKSFAIVKKGFSDLFNLEEKELKKLSPPNKKEIKKIIDNLSEKNNIKKYRGILA